MIDKLRCLRCLLEARCSYISPFGHLLFYIILDKPLNLWQTIRIA